MIQYRTVCLSAHLDSFCRRLNELRGLEFCYQTDDPGSMRRKVGWSAQASYANGPINAENTGRAKHCELLIEMLREPELFEARSKANLPTIYICERWFKPIPIYLHLLQFYTAKVSLPGHLRLIFPSYRKMAKRFVALMDDPNVWFLPCGVHAVRDFVRMYKILHGDIFAWLRQPAVAIDRVLAGSVAGFPRIRLWGYFVEPSAKSKSIVEGEGEWNSPRLESKSKKVKIETSTVRLGLQTSTLKLLWVGRMLDWKRVDVLIKAFKRVIKTRPASLIIAGEGPERKHLEKLSGAYRAEGLEWLPNKICFNNYIPSTKVRELMRAADVYVMPSNAEEGWGAAVSDALTEGCRVISTFEAGSSATLLPEENLYQANNVNELTNKLLHVEKLMNNTNITEWSGPHAAEKILEVTKC